MRLVHSLRLISKPTLETLKSSLKITIDEAPQYINKIRDEQKKIVYDRIDRLNKWYVKLIRLDEVKLYQDRVTSLQEQLLKSQEKRRDVGRQLADIRQKSLELQDQIHKVKRQEDLQRFLDLMKEETEILKLETSVSRTFQEYDQMERELFSAFANAIRDSHEKQRAQLEYTKYFGLILSMAGSFLAFVYTSIKKQDLKNFIEEKLTTLAHNSSDPVVSSLARANSDTLKEVVKNREALREVVRVLEERKVNVMIPQESTIGSGYRFPPSYDDGNIVDYRIVVAVSVCAFIFLVKMMTG